MIGKTMKLATAAAFALALAGGGAATAQTMPAPDPMQTTTPMPADPNQPMSNSMDMGKTMPKMSRSDTAAMKRCQAMEATAMAKSTRCTKLMQKYPQGDMTPM